MDIVLYAIGRTRSGYVNEGIAEYCARLSRYIPFQFIEIPDVRTTRAMTTDIQKIREGELILDRLTSSDFVVLLDEHGREYTSMGFSEYMQKLMASGRKRLVFVIGGSYGFSKPVYERADAKLSLSKMTFNHEMVRMFFVEQIYRAMTIMRGEPYHHE